MKRENLRGMLLLLTVFLLTQIACAAIAQPGPGKPRNAVLIGWDGAGRTEVREALGSGELHSLSGLASEGTIVAIDILRATETKPGWAQILTGYEPEKTRVFSNSRFQPIPRGYTVFERLEDSFGSNQIVTVAVIAKKNNLGADQGEPYSYTKEGMDVFLNGLTEGEAVCTKTLELLEQFKEKPFFFFVQFAEVDQVGHKSGENSKEYRDALVSVDAWTGRILAKLKALSLYDKTLVYVTADHGFDLNMKSHSDAPYVFLATNDPRVKRRGERSDITPTILTRFGLDLSRIEPPLDGHSLTRPYRPPDW